MSTRHEASRVGKIQVLRDEEPTRLLRCAPNFQVVASSQAFLRGGVDVMAEGGKNGNKRDG